LIVSNDEGFANIKEEDMMLLVILGKYLFFACLKDFPIGYCSWDERQYPVGIIGQNCILPEYQRQGYGRKQIELIINIFNDKNFNEIIVITGEH
jgi:GNAT superfamily N-acetyltransferase